jgi:ankyrin repeat protein
LTEKQRKYAASENGHLGVVEVLLGKGAVVDKARTHGTTTLHVASRNGHLGVVEVLLAKGAEVDKARTNGTTALHTASAEGHVGVVEALLGKGAEVDKASMTESRRSSQRRKTVTWVLLRRC